MRNCKALLGVLTVMVAGTAWAQDRARSIEEIVVTAEKREETLTQTPVSVAVFTPDQLEQIGVNNLGDITAHAANVDITPFPNSRSSLIIFMRGVGNNDSQTTQDPAVGVYLDGVYLGRTVGLTSDVADLERIEVLRGPQGTLYGRNTTGGAINMITARPAGQAGWKQLLGVGNRGHARLLTQVETADWNGLSAKMTLAGSGRDGWVNNIDPGPDFGEEDKRGGRFALSWQMGGGAVIDYSYDQAEIVGPQHFYQILSINEEAADSAMALENTLQQEFDAIVSGGGTPPDELANSLAATAAVNSIYVPQFRERASATRLDNGQWDVPVRDTITKVSGHSLIASWDLPFGELKSTSAWRDMSEFVVMDYGAGVEWFDVIVDIDHQQLSQELQLLGNPGDSLAWLGGVYWFEEQGFEHEIDTIGGEVGEDRTIWSNNKTWAAYGQLSWSPRFAPALDLTLGGRYTEDRRQARKHSINFENAADNTLEDAGRWSNFNPGLTLDYAFTDRINSYFRVTTGYKSGGFNTRSTENGFSPPFDEEEMISYEVGLKAMLLEDTIRLNLALYHSDYKDMQIQQILDNTRIFLTDVFNAGASKVDGLELEIEAILIEGLALRLGYGYTDAVFTEVIDNNPNSDTFGQDISAGYIMPYAPEHSLAFGLDYEFPSFGLGKLRASARYNWRDERYGTASNPDMIGFFLDDYGLADARLSWSELPMFGSRATLALWGKNLADEEYLVHDISMTYVRAGYFGEPRTFGLEWTLEF